MAEQSAELYDVVAVNIRNGNERVLDKNKTERDAEAVIKFAIVRRGVDTEFYVARPVWESL